MTNTPKKIDFKEMDSLKIKINENIISKIINVKDVFTSKMHRKEGKVG